MRPVARLTPALALGLVGAAIWAVAVGGAHPRGVDAAGQAGPAGLTGPAARIDQVLTEAYPPGEPGAAVRVTKAGLVLLEKGYGLADVERKVPATPDTVFRLASVTKAFTGTAVLMLAERGAIALDDPVTTHLPSSPPAWRAVTIRHLLSHTSGLPNYLDRPNSMEWAAREYTVQQLIESFRDWPAVFAPGERSAYSNSNYVLLGAIVEKVSGLPFDRFVETSVFAPLGMTATACGASVKDLSRLATAYEPARTADDQLDWSRLVVARPYSLSSVYAAGGCVSSLRDLARFHDALSKGALIGKAALTGSLTPAALRVDLAPTMSEGGWQLDRVGGRRAAMRSGALPGVCTWFLTMPDDDVSVILLSNRTPGKPRCGMLAVEVAGLAAGAAR
jgi:CubicO group peptidase (beta-lactamase class C family)